MKNMHRDKALEKIGNEVLTYTMIPLISFIFVDKILYNYQTSDLEEKYPSKKASGGIHRIGSSAVPSFR